VRINKAFHIFGCYCEELWKKDADTGTPIVGTKLPGSALFIQLYCLPAGRQVLAAGQDAGRTEIQIPFHSPHE
jgi:hypothetical protein